MGTAKGSSALLSTLTWTTFQRSPRRSMKDPCSGTDLSPSMSRSLSSSGRIAVVPEYYLPGGSHASLRTLKNPPRILPRPLSVQSRFVNQPVRNLFPVMIVGIVHRARKLGLEFVSKNRNVAGVGFSRLMLDYRPERQDARQTQKPSRIARTLHRRRYQQMQIQFSQMPGFHMRDTRQEGSADQDRLRLPFSLPFSRKM
jgi:hypothetical protein